MIRNALEWLLSVTRSPVETVENVDGGFSIFAPEDYTKHETAGVPRCRRTHTFADVGSLAAWLNRHADPKACEILVDERRVTAGLDPVRKKWDVVSASLTKHPRAVRWLSAFGTRMSQRAAYRHVLACLDDFDDHVVKAGRKTENLGSYGRHFADELGKFRAVRKGEFESILDPRGFFAVRGQSEKTTVSGKIPTKFEITIPYFLGIERPAAVSSLESPEGLTLPATYRLEVTVELEIGDTGPVFTFECPALAMVDHEARNDLVAHLENALEEGFLVGRGTFDAMPAALYPHPAEGEELAKPVPPPAKKKGRRRPVPTVAPAPE